MSKNIDFEIGTIVTDTFLDSLQELLTGTINNLRLSPTTAGTNKIALALVGDVINDKLGTVNIGGKYVYFDQLKICDSPVPTSPGSYDIYLSTTEADASLTPPAFRLTIGLPASYSFVRKIGTLYTDTTQVSDVKLKNGVMADSNQYNSFTFQSVIDVSGESILTLQGQDAQTSPAGATVTAPSSDPTYLLSSGHTVSGAYTEYMYLDSSGRLVWKNSGTDLTLSKIDSGILGTNAEISIRREGLNSLTVDDPTLDGIETITRDDGVVVISGRIDSDTYNRIQISQTGIILFGDGTNAPDVGFYRPKADSLALLSGDKLYLDYTLNFSTDGNNLAANKQYVDTAVGRANLDDLNDVDTSGVIDGSFLIYDNGTTTWVDSSDVTFTSGTLLINGDISAVDGTFTGNIGAVDGTFTGNVSAVDGTFTGRTTQNGTTNHKVSVIDNSMSPYTVTIPDDNTLLCQTGSGDITIVLPSVAQDGDIITIKDIDGSAGITNDLLVAGDTGVKIDDEDDYPMTSPYSALKVIHYSGNWFII